MLPTKPFLFSGRPIPQFHVTSTPTNRLFKFLVHIIMFSESSRMLFFSRSKTPTQDLHAYTHFDAAGAISLHNDIQDDMGPFSSIPSLRFHINSTDLPANYKCLAPQPHDSIIIIDARHCTGELRGDKRDGGNAALERTAFLIENNKYQFVSHFNYASVPSPQHPNDPITRISLRAV